MNTDGSIPKTAAEISQGLPPLPVSLWLSLILVAGIRAAEALQWTAVLTFPAVLSCLLVAWWLRDRIPHVSRLILYTAVLLTGGLLWTVRDAAEDGRDIGVLLREQPELSDISVRLTGTTACIPALDARFSAGNSGQELRTLFLVQAQSLRVQDQILPVRGLCRVSVDGDAVSLLRWGDTVELIGRLDLAAGPMNPGEFDFARYLRRSGISAMLFLRHPAAIQTLQSSGMWSARGLLTAFRQNTVALLESHLSPANRATAEALLLGNRGHMNPEIERDFVFSGTMHLLAISGLHVGILYVFIVRVFHCLLVPRTRALILAALVCVLYAFLTDLRPSVLRAALFIVLNVVGQLLYRDFRMGTLIGLTVLILVLCDPAIVFDMGAWLSFLAVGALGWVASRDPAPTDSEVPADIVTWRDRLRDRLRQLGHSVLRSYQQMLAVTVLSAPLIATQFHLVSVTGMVVNLLLIPLTTLTLIVGYVFVAIGNLLPILGLLAGAPFEGLLSLLNVAVRYSADVRTGFVMIPDLPNWFLPVWYGLLAGAVLTIRPVWRQGFRVALILFAIVQFHRVCERPTTEGLTCTVLSVGHGNAIVVEVDNRVLLFDAGAMNRGDGAADVIAGYLWSRGQRMVDTVVLSHADADHYNAVRGLLEKMPVGQVLTTSQFVQSASPEVAGLTAALQQLEVPTSLLSHGDSLRTDALRVQFLQSDAAVQQLQAASDNACSLVAVLDYRGHRLCLPGDLEGVGQQDLLQSLESCSVLVSPHHGSPAANPRALGQVTTPTHLIVSSKDDRHRRALRAAYPESRLLFTGLSGAIQTHVTDSGHLQIREYLEQPRAL